MINEEQVEMLNAMHVRLQKIGSDGVTQQKSAQQITDEWLEYINRVKKEGLKLI